MKPVQLEMEAGPGCRTSWATLSPDGAYRYELGRRWGPGPAVLWVMLNPSTADATTDDHTIRRCRAYAARWGLSALVVVNLYALRTPSPDALLYHDDPEGPANPATVQGWLEEVLEPEEDRAVTMVVVAWGGSLPLRRRPHHTDVMGMAAGLGVPLWCLGTIANGQPRHPSRGPYVSLAPFWTPGQAP